MKSFAKELELDKLDSFFYKCDLYPSNMDIEDGIKLYFKVSPYGNIEIKIAVI